MECPLHDEGLTEGVRNVLLNFTVGYIIDEPADSEDYGLRFFEEANAYQEQKVTELNKKLPELDRTDEYDAASFWHSIDSVRRHGVCFQQESVDRRRHLFAISNKQRIRIRLFLQKLFPFKILDDCLLDDIIDGMVRIEVMAGDTVMRQGDESQNVFMIESGAYEEWVTVSGVGFLLFHYDSWGCFGLASLIFPHAAPATVIAKKDGALWALNCAEYRSLVTQHERKVLELKQTCIDSLPFMSKLPQDEKDRLIDAIECLHFKKDSSIISYSIHTNGLYYIKSGQVLITYNNTTVGKEEISRVAGCGDHFGDLSMFCERLNGTRASALERCEILFLSASSFERLLGPFNRVVFPDHYGAPLVGYGRWNDSFKISLYREMKTLIREYRNWNLEDFLKLGLDYYKEQLEMKRQYGDCDAGNGQDVDRICGEWGDGNLVTSMAPQPEISNGNLTYAIEDVHPRGSQVTRIKCILKNIALFKALSEIKVQEIIERMQLVTVYAGHYVVKSGKLGQYFYLIENGEYKTVVNGDGVTHEILGCPNYFGELGLIMDVPRFADIMATDKGSLWALSRDNFRKVADSCQLRKKGLNYKLLKNVQILGSLTDYVIKSLSLSLENKTVEDREVPLTFQDDAVGMYFVKKGTIRVYSKTLKQNHVVARAGQNFGFLVFSMEKCDDIRAQSVGMSKVSLLKIEAFEQLLAHCRRVLHQNKCLQSKY